MINQASIAPEVFSADGHELILGDCIDAMRDLPRSSFDLAIVDPAYGASTRRNWGIPADHGLPGFGGRWTQAAHHWDQLNNVDEFQLILAWLEELRRLVRPTGSIWIHSTYHNSGFVNVGCQLTGLEIINEVVWFKRNAFPNLAGRRLTASHETLLWVHTGDAKNRKYRFNYEEVKCADFAGDGLKIPGKQLRTVWDIPNNKTSKEHEFGSHPTQKPLRLTQRLFTIAGTPGGRVLIPFLGSGTEAVAAAGYGMKALGFEIELEYFSLACQRLKSELALPRLAGL
jgi:site-specific DNA-methyltransferase (adenine-specific)